MRAARELTVDELNMVSGGIVAINSETQELIHFTNSCTREDIAQLQALIDRDGHVWTAVADVADELEKARIINASVK